MGKKLVPCDALSFEALRQGILRLSPEHLVQGLLRQVEGGFTGARVTKAAGTQGEVKLTCALLNHPLINDQAIGGEKIERDSCSTHMCGTRPIDLHQRCSIAMAQG